MGLRKVQAAKVMGAYNRREILDAMGRVGIRLDPHRQSTEDIDRIRYSFDGCRAFYFEDGTPNATYECGPLTRNTIRRHLRAIRKEVQQIASEAEVSWTRPLSMSELQEVRSLGQEIRDAENAQGAAGVAALFIVPPILVALGVSSVHAIAIGFGLLILFSMSGGAAAKEKAKELSDKLSTLLQGK